MASKKRSRALVQRPVARISGLPAGYNAFIEDLKNRIRSARLKAAFAVNSELILLYWDIGRGILARQGREGWGAKVVDRMARDLRKSFPEMRGFSPRNLKYMRAFAETYPKRSFVQQLVAQLPWGHNIILMEQVKQLRLREWYARKAIEHGWSRNVLVHQIELELHKRQGKALTNFKQTLPKSQSDLAQQTIKDPYTFDFLTLAADAKERDLEQGLMDHLQKFLLELGIGFAFVGRQVHMEVGDQDFYIDLLFYHLKLRCYVVIELKTGSFKPEYAGKMNFYLSAVDAHLRHKDDQPSVGIILCKSKNHLIAEYALRDSHKPIGVSAYKLTRALPQKLKGTLPTIKELEKELSDDGYWKAMLHAMGHDESEIEEVGTEQLLRSHSGTKYVRCKCGKFYELSWTEWPGFRDSRDVLCPKCKKILDRLDLDHITEITERDYLLKGQGRCPKDRTRLKFVKHHAYKPGSEEWDAFQCPKCRARYQIETL